MNPSTDTQAVDEFNQYLRCDVLSEEFAGVYNPGFGYYYQKDWKYEGITLGDIEAAGMAHGLEPLELSL